MTSAPTPEQAVASQIRAFRKRLDLTLNELAKRCADLGAPELSFSALANIERGATAESSRKPRQVSLSELLVIARALQVAPALLMFPVGAVDAVQVLPDLELPPWTALRWFAGEAYFSGEVGEYWAIPIYLNRQHDRWEAVLTSVLLGPPIEDDERVRERALHELRNVRAEMQRHGMTPPALPKDLEFVDQRRHAYLTPAEVEEAVARGETVRLLDQADPGRSRVQTPGDATRFGEALEQGRRFTEQWYRDHPDG